MRLRTAIAAVVVAIVLATLAGSARAAPVGALTPKGCFGAGLECGAGSNGLFGVDGAQGVAVSPDNRSVYVASTTSKAVARFDRDPASGALTYKDCFTQQASGCGAGNSAIFGLDGAFAVAVSPDGRSVYVAGEMSDAITRFDRDTTTGALTYQGCFTQMASGCGASNSGIIGLVGAAGVTVSPDNGSVYVASSTSQAIARFDRDTTTGALTYRECFTQQVGCANNGIAGLNGAQGVVVSPDNRSVYVASFTSDAIARFDRRATDGALTYEGCFTQQAGCATANGVAGLDGAESVAVSPDNRSVYVAGFTGQAITRFDRAAGGALSYQGCFTQQVSGCGAASSGVFGLAGAAGVAVSPDNRSVYVAGAGSQAIARFGRDPASGALSYQDCLTQQASGCGVGNEGITDLNDAESVAISPDNRSAYVASDSSSAIVRFDRALDVGPVCSAASPVSVPHATAAHLGFGCSEANGDPLISSVTGAPAHGSAVPLGGGSADVLYTPRGDYVGTDTLTVQGADTFGNAAAPVTITLRVRVASASRLSVSPHSFAAGTGKGASTARTRNKKPKLGAKVAYRLNAPSTVRFTVQRPSIGRTSARKCVRAKRSNRKHRRCTRYTTLKGSFSQAGRAATNSLHFTGRLNRKPLKAGHYRLTATPTSGKSVTKNFTITRP